MLLPLELGVRGGAIIFAAYCVAIMLLPASVVFGVTGVALIGIGIFLLTDSLRHGLLVIAAGIALIGMCIRTVRAARRHEEEEAKKAADTVAKACGKQGLRR